MTSTGAACPAVRSKECVYDSCRYVASGLTQQAIDHCMGSHVSNNHGMSTHIWYGCKQVRLERDAKTMQMKCPCGYSSSNSSSVRSHAKKAHKKEGLRTFALSSSDRLETGRDDGRRDVQMSTTATSINPSRSDSHSSIESSSPARSVSPILDLDTPLTSYVRSRKTSKSKPRPSHQHNIVSAGSRLSLSMIEQPLRKLKAPALSALVSPATPASTKSDEPTFARSRNAPSFVTAVTTAAATPHAPTASAPRGEAYSFVNSVVNGSGTTRTPRSFVSESRRKSTLMQPMKGSGIQRVSTTSLTSAPIADTSAGVASTLKKRPASPPPTGVSRPAKLVKHSKASSNREVDVIRAALPRSSKKPLSPPVFDSVFLHPPKLAKVTGAPDASASISTSSSAPRRKKLDAFNDVRTDARKNKPIITASTLAQRLTNRSCTPSSSSEGDSSGEDQQTLAPTLLRPSSSLAQKVKRATAGKADPAPPTSDEPTAPKPTPVLARLANVAPAATASPPPRGGVVMIPPAVQCTTCHAPLPAGGRYKQCEQRRAKGRKYMRRARERRDQAQSSLSREMEARIHRATVGGGISLVSVDEGRGKGKARLLEHGGASDTGGVRPEFYMDMEQQLVTEGVTNISRTALPRIWDEVPQFQTADDFMEALRHAVVAWTAATAGQTTTRAQWECFEFCGGYAVISGKGETDEERVNGVCAEVAKMGVPFAHWQDPFVRLTPGGPAPLGRPGASSGGLWTAPPYHVISQWMSSYPCTCQDEPARAGRENVCGGHVELIVEITNEKREFGIWGENIVLEAVHRQ